MNAITAVLFKHGAIQAQRLILDSKKHEMIMLLNLSKNAGNSKELEYQINDIIEVVNVFKNSMNGKIIDSWIENGHEKYLCLFDKNCKMVIRKKDISKRIK